MSGPSTPKKALGAWVIHHASKLQQVTNPQGYDATIYSGKCALLLSALAESEAESNLPKKKVEAIAKACGVNVHLELDTLLAELKRQRLVDRSATGEVQVLGVTTTATLEYAYKIFTDRDPSNEEHASINLAEAVSDSPIARESMETYVADSFHLTEGATQELIDYSVATRLIDQEGKDSKLLFNGNVFRSGSVEKTYKVLQTLSAAEAAALREFEALITSNGCVSADVAVKTLTQTLYDKVVSVGLYDVLKVSNSKEAVHYITKPSAFSKFGNAAVEDALDLAKALTAALTYGMTRSRANRGRIQSLSALMSKLINGYWVGPATAIGEDYRLLELKRVIQTKREGDNMFKMKLLKKDVGELALQVLTTGSVDPSAMLSVIPGASVEKFEGPEANRLSVRAKQSVENKRGSMDILHSLRTAE